jgi:hypothetical protein
LECLDPDSIIVDVGTFAAIRLIPTRTGDILVRILKHGRVEDLFPADYIVKGEGCIRAYSLKNSAYFGKYDFEVYVDEEFSYLLQRVDWLDKGATGRDSMTTLVAENNSLRTGIFIKSPNGKVQEYTNDRVDFKIVDFDVVDDDGDGVFEPGSFVRVENIKIANVGIAFMKTTLMTGSIPCPAGISLSLGASRWIRPVGNLQVKAIPADSEVTLDGCLRGFIDVKSECVNFCAMETIYLTANLSELNMQSSIVSIEKMISISYPLHLEIVHCPSWIAPGSSAEISWRVCHFRSHLY